MKLIYRIRPPCPKCAYTLGLVRTTFNPCHTCRESGYRSYELFKEIPVWAMTGKSAKGGGEHHD